MGSKRAPEVDKQRSTNLRQRLLQASRVVNATIVKGLQERGFRDLRSTHTSLLSNLEIGGSSLTNVARRAGMTKQAMGRLADELIRLGYIDSTRDEVDRRAISLVFTDAGLDLMQQSFEVMNDIETRCAKRIGKSEYKKLLHSLVEIATVLEDALPE